MADIDGRRHFGGAMRPIRIARVVARLSVGGPSLQVGTLTSRLPAQFESRLFIGAVAPGEREMTEVLDRENVVPIRVPGLGRAVRPSSDLRALLDLVKHFRSFRPHIVHTHTAKAGTLGRIAARLCKVPVVVHTFHGHVFSGYFSAPATRAIISIERGLSRLTTRIVTISARQFDDITRRYRITTPARACIIPLGFDLERFRVQRARGAIRAELGLTDEPLVTIVGRLAPIKDHPILFEAFRMMSDKRAQLCVVGGGECEPELRSLAARLQIDGRTHFMGFREDIDSILRDSDLVVLTSRNEGTPVALIEAMAAGCRPVAFDVGGVSDVLGEGRWGRVVHERSAPALASALGDELHAVALAGRTDPRVEEGRRHVFAQYGHDRLLRDHEALYCSLLRDHR